MFGKLVLDQSLDRPTNHMTAVDKVKHIIHIILNCYSALTTMISATNNSILSTIWIGAEVKKPALMHVYLVQMPSKHTEL